jgi:hypothetical protein
VCSPDVGVNDVADFEVDRPVWPHEMVARRLLHPRRRVGCRPHRGPRRVHRRRRRGLGFRLLQVSRSPPVPLLAKRVCEKIGRLFAWQRCRSRQLKNGGDEAQGKEECLLICHARVNCPSHDEWAPTPSYSEKNQNQKRGQGVFPFFSFFFNEISSWLIQDDLIRCQPMLVLRNFSGRNRKTEEVSSAT